MKNTTKLYRQKFYFCIAITLAIFAAIILLTSELPGNTASAHSDSLFVTYLPVVRGNPAPVTIFGAALDSIPPSVMDLMVGAGISWDRITIKWSDVEPYEGDRRWDQLASIESRMIYDTKNNIIPIIVVESTPTWAQKFPGIFCGPIKSDKLGAFGKFMSDAATRYMIAPYQINYWELGNEPDISFKNIDPTSGYGCWGDDTDPYFGGDYYGEMLKAAYPMIKASNPLSQVLIGGLLLNCDPNNPPSGKDCTSSRFFEGILKNGGGAYFDVVSFHAYEYYGGTLGRFGNTNWNSYWNSTGTSLTVKVRYLKSLLMNYGVSGKFLMNTESALLCDACTNNSNFEATKAYYITRNYAEAVAEGLKGNLWFSTVGWRNSQLINQDLTLRPGYYAYMFAYKELSNAAYSKSLNFNTVRGYEVKAGNKAIWIVWSMDEGSHEIDLGTIPAIIYDAQGASQTILGTKLSVGMKPLYIEFSR